MQSDSERNNFWRYNNGITITCESISEPPPSHPGEITKVKRYLIKSLQVVNGLQTIEALYENPKREEWGDRVKVMVRIIPTSLEFSADPENARLLEEHIAEYSNSQTPIEPRDLRANDSVQREIERVLSTVYTLRYIRKVGEQRGSPGRPGISRRVDNEKAAQAALAFWWNYSYEAKAKKRLIFEKKQSAMKGYYEMIFNGQTTAEYVLLPFLFWDQTRQFIRKHANKEFRGPYKALDLLAVAVVGDALRRRYHLLPTTSNSQKIVDLLGQSVRALQGSRETDRRKLWKNVFSGLYKTAERRQKTEARRLHKDIEKVYMRNIILGMKYTMPEVRREIHHRPEIKRVPSLLKRLV